MSFNIKHAQQLLTDVAILDTFPDIFNLIEMTEILEVFVNDTESRMGIQMYKNTSKKQHIENEFNYKRDIKAAMRDYFSDHHIEKLKWTVPYNLFFDLYIDKLCKQYNHKELLENISHEIKEVKNYFIQCSYSTPSIEEAVQSHRTLSNTVRNYKKVNKIATIISQMR